MLYSLHVKETIGNASVTPKKARIWIGKAESPEITHWRELSPDPPCLRRLSQKVADAFRPMIEQNHELKVRVNMDKLELAKQNEVMSGRAIYWIILNELKTSRNTFGLMNLTDLQHVLCKGPRIHHLRTFDTHWDACLMNFAEQPAETLIQPMYEVQVKVCDDFKTYYDQYELDLIRGEEKDRSYPKLRQWVKWACQLKQQQDNDAKALKNDPEHLMSLWEDSHSKFRNGDCKTYFKTGKC